MTITKEEIDAIQARLEERDRRDGLGDHRRGPGQVPKSDPDAAMVSRIDDAMYSLPALRYRKKVGTFVRILEWREVPGAVWQFIKSIRNAWRPVHRFICRMRKRHLTVIELERLAAYQRYERLAKRDDKIARRSVHP